MKKIVLSIFLAITLIAALTYIFFNHASASISQRFREVDRTTGSDGLDTVTYELYIILTGSSSLNHIEGAIDLLEYDLIDFQAEGEFQVVSWDDRNLTYSLTSNKLYTSSDGTDGEVVFATVTVKETGEYPCHFNFIPGSPSTVPTNEVSITKNAVSKMEI